MGTRTHANTLLYTCTHIFFCILVTMCLIAMFSSHNRQITTSSTEPFLCIFPSTEGSTHVFHTCHQMTVCSGSHPVQPRASEPDQWFCTTKPPNSSEQSQASQCCLCSCCAQCQNRDNSVLQQIQGKCKGIQQAPIPLSHTSILYLNFCVFSLLLLGMASCPLKPFCTWYFCSKRSKN